MDVPTVSRGPEKRHITIIGDQKETWMNNYEEWHRSLYTHCVSCSWANRLMAVCKSRKHLVTIHQTRHILASDLFRKFKHYNVYLKADVVHGQACCIQFPPLRIFIAVIIMVVIIILIIISAIKYLIIIPGSMLGKSDLRFFGLSL